MDHTPQHAIFKLEHDGKIDLYRPEVDLAHAGNVRVQASMTNGVLRSEDPAFIKVQRARLKFFVPSTGKLYGLGTDCGPKLKESAEQKCSDFWGRWTKDSFERCEVVLLDDMAVQPSLELLRAQARESVASFKAHELPPPKTWIRPGGWEGPVDWRRMKAVYGDEFGYKIVDSSGGEGLEPYSQWNYSSDFGFFDFVPDVEKVYAKAVAALERGHSFAYISHQWTKDRAKYLDQCRQLAAKLLRVAVSGGRLVFAQIVQADDATPPHGLRLEAAGAAQQQAVIVAAVQLQHIALREGLLQLEAEHAALLGSLVNPEFVGLVGFCLHTELLQHKGIAEDVVQVQVGIQQVLHGQLIALDEGLQRLLLLFVKTTGVYHCGLVGLVPQYIAVDWEHVEFKFLYFHTASCVFL